MNRGPVRTCKGCGQPILWAFTQKGKLMPLDPTPSPDGGFYLVNGEDELGKPKSPLAVSTSAAEDMPEIDPEDPRFVAHWATCKKAGDFRRSGSA